MRKVFIFIISAMKDDTTCKNCKPTLQYVNICLRKLSYIVMKLVNGRISRYINSSTDFINCCINQSKLLAAGVQQIVKYNNKNLK